MIKAKFLSAQKNIFKYLTLAEIDKIKKLLVKIDLSSIKNKENGLIKKSIKNSIDICYRMGLLVFLSFFWERWAIKIFKISKLTSKIICIKKIKNFG